MKPLIPGLAEKELRQMVHGSPLDEQAVMAEALDVKVLIAEIARRLGLRTEEVQEFVRLAMKITNEENRRIGAI